MRTVKAQSLWLETEQLPAPPAVATAQVEGAANAEVVGTSPVGVVAVLKCM